MPEFNSTIRHISWRDLFPWLILLRTFRIAIAPSVLALSTLAVLVWPVGWRVADFVFRPEQAELPARAVRVDSPSDAPPLIQESPGAWRQRIPRTNNSQLRAETPAAAAAYLPAARTALLEAYFDFSEPVRRCFQLKMTVREMAYCAFGALWTLVLWAFPGGVITRRAIVQLATESPPAIIPAAAYAGRRYLWYLLAPLAPIFGVLLFALPIAVLGLPIRWWPGAGSVLAGLAWILVAVAGLAAMWLLGGVIFGWPLMWPTISAERDGDPFEAFSRSYSYVYGKPLHYFFYVVIAALFGALCWAAVEVAAVLVQEFGFWALALGGGGRNVEVIRSAAVAFATSGVPLDGQPQSLLVGTTLIGLVVALIRAVAVAFRYSYFFCAAAAIYLLLRQDVDEKEIDEVYLDDRPVAAPAQATAAAPAAQVPTPPSAGAVA